MPAVGGQDDYSDDDGLLLSLNDGLVDNGFLASRTQDQANDASAEESLIRVLEAGPCVLEAVKEAAGALKVILAGAPPKSSSCHNSCTTCKHKTFAKRLDNSVWLLAGQVCIALVWS